MASDEAVRQIVQALSAPEDRGPAMGSLYANVGGAMPEAYANPNIGVGAMVSRALGSLATLPRRAMENSQHSLDSGTYDPGPTLEAAMLPMGTGAIAGVPVRAGEAVLGAGPIRAYHGSPYDFDRFDLGKIGTGERAQAYGHGLYFSENEQVAKAYRDALTPVGQPGRVYETNIHANPEHFLDWEKPFGQQSASVQSVIPEIFEKKLPGWNRLQHADDLDLFNSGRELYRTIAGPQWKRTDGFAPSTQALNAAGIPGIKYLDQGSRGAGQGSSNYVVFNDKIIDIMRKYGMGSIAALPPATLAALSQGDQQY